MIDDREAGDEGRVALGPVAHFGSEFATPRRR